MFRSKKAAPKYDELFRNIDFNIISKADRVAFEAPFTSLDVWNALKAMHPTKAPGLDDYHAKFYQVHWDKLGHKLSSLIVGFLNDGIPFHDLNATFIALIPKVKKHESMNEFRPISLCNVMYKILSKMVVNRIKPILPCIVGDAQSAFISNRLITNNIIIASEVFHWLNLQHMQTQGSAFVVKIDE